MKHYQEKLSAYLHHELPADERQTIAEHLLRCAACRREHDQIKLGAELARQLAPADAPADLWRAIENSLDRQKEAPSSPLARFSFFKPRALAAACFTFSIVFLAIIFGVSSLMRESEEVAENNPERIVPQKSEAPVSLSTPGAFSPANRQTDPQNPATSDSNVQTAPPKANENMPIASQTKPFEPKNNQVEPKIKTPKIAPVEPKIKPVRTAPAWEVETIAGMPTAGNQTIAQNGKLAVGEFLETDADSRARVQVADIGEVEIAPNSRVQLVNTTAKEHRLALKKGVLQAKIFAPPRLFIVDTPSAAAIDLGCEYTLEVDAEGNSKLHVTSGFVALERDGRESIVPAGAFCLTKKGMGLGTPFAESATAAFSKALYEFDFAAGGALALDTIIKESDLYDSLTLWHLLPRVQKTERERVFAALAKYVAPPAGVTREGVLRLDRKMLDRWWSEIEKVWFE